MSGVTRLGAVDYLNVRPLVYGLDRHADRVSLRFDSPADCARLLAAGEIDLGMVPSITYLDRPSDRIVPGVCIGSHGPVASVALFLRKPVRDLRTLAVDTSSRTSAALARILFARMFDATPAFLPHPPDLSQMLLVADGALLIGDPALFADPTALGVTKIDLGQIWTEMTGLPFVWAFWSGPPPAISSDVVQLLRAAATEGMDHIDAIAEAHFSDAGRRAVAARYLRENLMFRLDDRAVQGLRTYYDEAVALGLASGSRELDFFLS
jgi:predicted solute-binding protein